MESTKQELHSKSVCLLENDFTPHCIPLKVRGNSSQAMNNMSHSWDTRKCLTKQLVYFHNGLNDKMSSFSKARIITNKLLSAGFFFSENVASVFRSVQIR